MRQELTTQGRVELTHEEVTEAVMNYVSKEEKKLTQAVDAWLRTKHHLQTVRVRYSKNTEGIQVVADVKGQVADPVTKFSDDPKKERNSSDGFIRKNVGVFKFIKEFIEDERKKNIKKIDFSTIFNNVKFSFPNMDENRLAVYLHDRRMLPNISFSKKNEVVIVK